ncbi:response regulator [Terrihabitans soli]|uniref:Response regulator n=1 Tax=Terrihabitans soli TaxID=708113 RepID=A0A6S6QRH5_9HYPH|nr:response regulator [Terrihabitans soli]BCJ90557.1 response regulator [Terrihabitans soli]
MSKDKFVVAVVDDDTRLLESLDDLLDSAGYSVRPFSSAKAFLASDWSDVDLLITDIGMPDIDGLELRDRVGRSRPKMPVFLITGRHEIADQQRTQGIRDLFRKPFDGSALLSALNDALQNRKQGDGHDA